MDKFKVGDTVKVIRSHMSDLPVGYITKIIKRLSTDVNSQVGIASLNEPGYAWWHVPDQLELVHSEIEELNFLYY